MTYENREELNHAIATYINEGLRRGQLCVYATVCYRDEEHIKNFSTLIDSYKENVDKGNLLIVDLAPFYIASLVGDVKPFEDATKLYAENVKERADKHIRFVGDGTGFLFKNRHFDECAMLEEWWQDKPFEGSYVCLFSKQSLNSYPYDMYSNHAIVGTHDIVIDASDIIIGNSNNGQMNDQQSLFPQFMQGVNKDNTRLNMEGGNK